MDVRRNKVQTCAQELQITAFQQAQTAAISSKLNPAKSIIFNLYGGGGAAEADRHEDIPASMFGDAIRNKHGLKYRPKSLETMTAPRAETFPTVSVGSWSVSGREEVHVPSGWVQSFPVTTQIHTHKTLSLPLSLTHTHTHTHTPLLSC